MAGSNGLILGIGVDIVSIARIASSLQNPAFATRVLTPAEAAYCGGRPERVAGRWAAKEAIAKALGRPLSWSDVEILSGPKGEPTVHVCGLTHARARVTISHEKEYAVAFAIIETDEPPPSDRPINH